MSDSDDSDIQADIQALTEALSLPVATSDSRRQIARDQSSPSDSTPSIDLRSDDEQLGYIDVNQDFESLNAYEMNAQLISGLLIAKKKLLCLLQECERKIQELDEKMSSGEGSSSRIPKHAISTAGMPYFKDKNHFRAPKNDDTKLKESRGELFLPSLRKPSRWSGEDREKLLRAVHNEAIESVLTEGFDNIDKQLVQLPEMETANGQAKRIMVTLPRNFREMVGTIGEKEFDWHKISRMDFEDKHSPGECQAMWNIYLHPDFNKNEWTAAEDERLVKYAKECKYQDWDTIAQLLETSRSAYQCFIRYNTIKKMPFSGRPWTKEEDKCLTNIIDQLRVGDYIPWTDIANHLRYRTKQQIYSRWIYRKAPHLRKGRFTYLETKTLMNAVEKYGLDFCKISNTVMPNRTSVQLSERYHTIITAKNNMWTIEEDKKLLELHNKHNNHWSKIATYLNNKSRTQTRHRFKAIQKQLKKNVSLEDMHRPQKNLSICKKPLAKNPLKECKIIRARSAPVAERRVIQIYDIQLRLYEGLSLPLSKSVNCQNSYDSKQLVYDTSKLYATLNLLNANLELSKSFLSHAHLNRREKRLVVFMKDYINVRNDTRSNYERIENVRMQMFGCVKKISEDPFIPYLPFDGHVRTSKKMKSSNNQSTSDQLINNTDDEKIRLKMPIEFTLNPDIESLVSVEEKIQFHKLGQLLVRDYHECDKQMRANLYKLECKLSFNKTNKTGAEYHTGNEDVQTRRYKKRFTKSQIMPVSEYSSEKEKVFRNIITPNQATLLGLKNLLLWKLLYDYEHDKSERRELFLEIEQKEEEETMTDCPEQMESAEYRLLQARLLQLFKLPIGLSNTMLEVCGPEPIFSTNEEQDRRAVSRKRKFRNSDSDVETVEDVPVVSNSKVICKRYKIVAK